MSGVNPALEILHRLGPDMAAALLSLDEPDEDIALLVSKLLAIVKRYP